MVSCDSPISCRDSEISPGPEISAAKLIRGRNSKFRDRSKCEIWNTQHEMIFKQSFVQDTRSDRNGKGNTKTIS